MGRRANRRPSPCPQAGRDEEGHILCRAAGGKTCAHQRFCGMRGAWIHTDQAITCPMKNGREKHAEHV